MAKAKAISLPLNERVVLKNTLTRTMDLIILFLLFSLLAHRLFFITDHGLPWLVAFFCELWFTFTWVLTVNAKWSPVDFKTFPERLLHGAFELPAVDMFVTTADPVLEPPIIVVNTVLSLLAVDYPADKLACYVSDDGGSALTFYALMEATKFAELWVPFCKKHGVRVRAPFRYFSAPEPEPEPEDVCCLGDHSLQLQFQEQRTMIKNEYEKLVQKIEDAAQKPSLLRDLIPDFHVFSKIEPSDHPSIVKVIRENRDGLSDGLPHMIYVSREKRPKHHHHYKAGAMNALTRVSGVMTNAPYMLNVDCDMYAHNPLVVQQAMCLFLGLKGDAEIAFVQSPQHFYDGHGESLKVLQEFLGRGTSGIQGPVYQGTGCFHRRKVMYGAWPEDADTQAKNLTFVDGNLSPDELQKRFGGSVELADKAARVLSGSDKPPLCQDHLSSLVDEACKLADCEYEYGTSWGATVGWIYGTTVEDILTGMKIHAKGWRSAYNAPDPPAFLGCAPTGMDAITQQKRWATGLLEILINRNNLFKATRNERLQLRQCLCYLYPMIWPVRSIPELCYTLLPAYCIITNSYFLPKGPSMCMPLALFVIYNLCTLREYLQVGASAFSWWVAQAFGRIISATAWFFGVIGVATKLLGVSKPVFDITRKENQDQAASSGGGGLIFDDSPLFVPPTTVSLVHLTALAIAMFRSQPLPCHVGAGSGMWEILCSTLVLIYFWPFVQGLFRRGRYGIPAPTIVKSAVLSLLFVNFCQWTSVV